DDRPMLLRNDGGNRANWIEFEMAGTASNRSGIGARVKVVAGGLVQFDHVRAGGGYLSGNDLRLHFGLAGHKRADVEVRWPSGTAFLSSPRIGTKLSQWRGRPGSNRRPPA